VSENREPNILAKNLHLPQMCRCSSAGPRRRRCPTYSVGKAHGALGNLFVTSDLRSESKKRRVIAMHFHFNQLNPFLPQTITSCTSPHDLPTKQRKGEDNVDFFKILLKISLNQ
jgi:hypothetical protein